MQAAGTGPRPTGETLTPRTGVISPDRPEDTAGGLVAKPVRRDVLKYGLFGAILAILGGGGAAFLSYFYPKKTSLFGAKILVQGSVSDYPVGTVLRVREGKFYLSHVPEGFVALYWKCKHLGCTVPWKPDEEFQGQQGVFHCPCHGSVYLRTGQNVAGPAPAPLDLMPITVAGGKITVDTAPGRLMKRVRWEPTQATKA